jgi:hypothetical protein
MRKKPSERSRPARWSWRSVSMRRSAIRWLAFVTTAGFRRVGAAIARLGLPTVFVQEGGYLSDILGANLTAALGGFEEAR